MRKLAKVKLLYTFLGIIAFSTAIAQTAYQDYQKKNSETTKRARDCIHSILSVQVTRGSSHAIANDQFGILYPEASTKGHTYGVFLKSSDGHWGFSQHSLPEVTPFKEFVLHEMRDKTIRVNYECKPSYISVASPVVGEAKVFSSFESLAKEDRLYAKLQSYVDDIFKKNPDIEITDDMKKKCDGVFSLPSTERAKSQSRRDSSGETNRQ